MRQRGKIGLLFVQEGVPVVTDTVIPTNNDIDIVIN